MFKDTKLKTLFASDFDINSKLEHVLRSNSFCVMTDLNDFGSDSFGLTQDASLLNRLSTVTHNGFDFDYEKLNILKKMHTLDSFHNSYTSVNKRVAA